DNNPNHIPLDPYEGWQYGQPHDNHIDGNVIGLTAPMNKAAGNLLAGIHFAAESNDNVIGGASAGQGNIIAGNLGDGIQLGGTNQKVLGNRIGTNLASVTTLGNAGDGIRLDGYGHVIGGDRLAGEGNIIGRNANGIESISGQSTVLGNMIGFAYLN